MSSCLVVIPARLASTRFPRKVLAKLGGRTMSGNFAAATPPTNAPSMPANPTPTPERLEAREPAEAIDDVVRAADLPRRRGAVPVRDVDELGAAHDATSGTLGESTSVTAPPERAF